jgi:pimeloyl-ACP methyl ester carboxylesterase
MSTTLPDIGDIATARIDGLDIRYARSGAPDGVPVLLTSPWPESIYAFRDILPAISDRHHLLAVDLPGFGRSEGRRDLMSPQAMGDFVIKIASHFDIGRMHSVGPDIGTLALLFAAVRQPGLFESIVVGSGASSPELAAGRLKYLIASPAGYFDAVEGGALAVQSVKASAAHATPDAVLEDYRRSSEGRRFEEAVNFVRAYPHDLPLLRALLPGIETPTLVLAGNHDPIVPPANGQLLADLLPHSRFTLLEGGHLIWEDAADQYAAHLANWLSGEYRTV